MTVLSYQYLISQNARIFISISIRHLIQFCCVKGLQGKIKERMKIKLNMSVTVSHVFKKVRHNYSNMTLK